MPIVKLAHFPTSVYSTWTCALHALGCFTNKSKPRFHLYITGTNKKRVFIWELHKSHKQKTGAHFPFLFYFVACGTLK